MIDFTEAELRSFAPRMAEFYKRALLDGKVHLEASGILDNGKRFAHFMGQCGAETGGFTIVRESLNYTSAKRIAEVWPARAKKSSTEELQSLVRNPVGLGDWAYGGRLGNRKGKIGKPHHDGYDFRGGGWLQTTGRANVQKYCDLCRIEIRPDILDDPIATLLFACAEWEDAGCNKLADANDILGISKAINTGSATSSVAPNGMEHRTAWFAKAKAIWWDADDVKVTETVPPPTVAQNMQSTAANSRTVFGSLVGVIGAVLTGFKEYIAETASQIVSLAPAKDVLAGFGLSATKIVLVVTVAGCLYAIYARIDAAHKGKVG